MIASLKLRVLLAAMALLVVGMAYSRMPAEKSEAAIVSQGYFNFSYNTATQRGTWEYRFIIDDTFTQTYQFTVIQPTGTQLTATSPAALNCGALPATPTFNCTWSVPPGGTTLIFTMSSPYVQQCTAQNVLIGGIIYQNTTPGFPGPLTVVPGSFNSSVGGLSVPNTVPANAALCPTPIPNTPVPPTATPTPVVIVQPVIPQVFQHVPQGIFNGSRNNTPTPARPVTAAPSTGIAGSPATMPVLRPPSTGDAGLKLESS